MSQDTPPLRPFVLKPEHIKGLRWSMDQARVRNETLYRIDMPMLEALVDAAETLVFVAPALPVLRSMLSAAKLELGVKKADEMIEAADKALGKETVQ